MLAQEFLTGYETKSSFLFLGQHSLMPHADFYAYNHADDHADVYADDYADYPIG